MTGRYRLVESIGQGGMGRVWRATDEVLDRQVAVKEMRIDGLDSEDTRTRRERTLREARATARIDHPNVVRVYDVVDEGERLWIVMELVAGRSLERIMAEEGPLGPHETARIGLGLVTALRQVHARGVLHRDIKPGNVLVEGGGSGGDRGGGGNGGNGESGVRRIVLTDFGIAAIQDTKALTMVGMLVGSPDYMAPERISGHPQGPPSDVWSLGATLCAALAGHSPFSRDTTLATLHAVLYEEPRLPSNAGPLYDILTALLAKEPTARPTLTDLESTLERIAFAPPPPQPNEVVAEAAEEEAGEGPGEEAGEGAGEEKAETGSSTRVLLNPVKAPHSPEPPATADASAGPSPGASAGVSLGAFADSSSEAASEMRSESGSEPPSPSPPGTPTPRSGISLARSRAVTERNPAPHPAPHSAQHPAPHSATTRRAGLPPGGELPGPAVPAASGAGRRRSRGGTGSRTGGVGGWTGRRTGTVAAVGVVVVATVLAIVLASAPGSHDGDNQAGGSSPKPSPVTGSGSGSGLGSGSGSGSSPSASPTVEGTFRPPSLPPGTHQEAGGFAWATPRGWRRDVKTGAEVHYTSPDGTQELVAKSSLARGDLMDTWRTSERNAHQGRDYSKIRLEETTFRGRPAVVWEYTFTLQGTPWHARLLGFDESGKSYQINIWYQPAAEAAALKTYEKVKDSFTVT
ncbi:serine/threonine-protein kinase [Streptomyces sp. Root1310]|uniref:serine/threonine-protein kinase n=1 Tax=Streptomyces sp. Root1310 TaxID=1736452 RepID=UPI00099EBF1C|nr:serine/threonine-protein kinase [Streptomyces sp. Root1310]